MDSRGWSLVPPLRKDKRAELFRKVHERQAIRLIAAASHEKVDVIGHEAIGDFFHVRLEAGVKNLPMHGVDDFRCREAVVASMRAKREEIPAQTDIGLRIKMRAAA